MEPAEAKEDMIVTWERTRSQMQSVDDRTVRGIEEHTTPSRWTGAPSGSIAGALWEAETQPDRVALAYRGEDGFCDVTVNQVAEQVRRLARGLIAAGVSRGDRICLFSPTRVEFTYLDFAIWSIGGVAVTIYETSSADQVEWIVSDSGAKVMFISGGDRFATFAERAGRSERPPEVFDFDDLTVLEEMGAGVPDTELHRRLAAVKASDLATLVYTSGTTGKPKGVELTHANLQWTLGNTLVELGDLFHQGASTLMFLPLAHIFARMIQVAAIQAETVIYYSSGLPNLVEELQMTRPTFIFAAPRVFEKLHDRARQKAREEGKERIFDLAAATAVRYSQEKATGSLSVRTVLLHALFEPLVYRKLRAVLGGRVRHALSGSAPLGERLGHFYRGIGVEVLEGYGLTETSAGGAVNLPDAVRIGSVGRPTPGSTVRIVDDGEILIKGGHVMRGYWNNPSATAEVLDEDGWLHTGDIGHLDEDGYLWITGRKKEIIVTAGGKNVAPAVLEDLVRAHPLVGGCVVVGDNRPFISALVSIDPDTWVSWAGDHGLDGPIAKHTDRAELVTEISEAVAQANRAVSRAEAIRAFRVLPEDFTIEGGELTTSLKVRRSVVEAKYVTLIDEIYSVARAQEG